MDGGTFWNQQRQLPWTEIPTLWSARPSWMSGSLCLGWKWLLACIIALWIILYSVLDLAYSMYDVIQWSWYSHYSVCGNRSLLWIVLWWPECMLNCTGNTELHATIDRFGLVISVWVCIVANFSSQSYHIAVGHTCSQAHTHTWRKTSRAKTCFWDAYTHVHTNNIILNASAHTHTHTHTHRYKHPS